MSDFSPEVTAKLELVEKLMRKAGKTDNAAEQALFQGKAQDILDTLNLDMTAVEQVSGGKSKRADEQFKGGLYQWQRDLWERLAQLNFCFYWNQYNYDPEKKRRMFERDYWTGKRTSLGTVKGGYRFQHRLVGRKINVVAVKVMAEYLQGTIERMAREAYPDPAQYFCKDAVEYREGIAETVCHKIWQRYSDKMNEDRVKQEAARKRADEAAAKGISLETAISLETLAKTEREANIDFMYGDGTSAKWAAERAAAAAAEKAAREAYTKWAEANPEEAAAEAKKEREESRKRSARSSGRSAPVKYKGSAYFRGKRDGEKVSIDQQADGFKSAGSLG